MEAISVLRHAATGFFGYSLPMALMKRGRVSRVMLRSAAAFAVFTGGYKLVAIVLKAVLAARRKRPSSVLALESAVERLSPAVAAGVAALAGNAVDPSFSSSFFVIWLFLRAVRTLDVVPSHPALAPLVMVAAVEVIVPGGFNNPEEMHPTYQKFLESFSVGVDVEKMRNPRPGKAIGDVVHRFPSDTQFMFRHVYPSLALASCQVYWPLHTVSAAINWFAWRRKSDGVAGALDSLAENILRSTAFLTGWVGTMWWAVMMHSRHNLASTGSGKVLRQHTMMWAWLGGLWVLLEKQGRQVELATYCGAHAINSLYNRYSAPRPRLGTALLVAACGMLVHSWSKQPNAVTKLLFFGDQTD